MRVEKEDTDTRCPMRAGIDGMVEGASHALNPWYWIFPKKVDPMIEESCKDLDFRQ